MTGGTRYERGGDAPGSTLPGAWLTGSEGQSCQIGKSVWQGTAGGEAKGLHLTRTSGAGGREKPLASVTPTVPQTDTGRRVEDTQARERTLVKELGKLAP